MNAAKGSSWSTPETVAGFAQARPNETLLAFAAGGPAREPAPAPPA